MIACLDVHYEDPAANAACICINDWRDAVATTEHMKRIDNVEPYIPGEFYRRELPCLISVLDTLPLLPDFAIVDGFVWLTDGKPGLGAHLFDALKGGTSVIGVAKTAFHRQTNAVQVFRGESKNPLYVTAAGIDIDDAITHVQSMAGTARIPAMLRRVDRLARSSVSPMPSDID